MSWRVVAATILLVMGAGLQVTAVIGLVAMRDVYDRLHLVGLAGIGVLFVGVAIVVRESFSLIGDKALGAGLLVVFLGPILVHTTARSFRIREHGDWRAGIDEHREEPGS